MSFANPNAPNLPDFLTFIQTNMEVPVAALPADSPWPGYSFNRAMNQVIQVPTIPGLEYTIAVYNCAAHILISITPDQPGQSFFSGARTTFNLLATKSGVVQSAGDQSTSAALSVPDSLRNMTIGDLDFYRTPWGRQYLSFAQDFGSVWGLT